MYIPPWSNKIISRANSSMKSSVQTSAPDITDSKAGSKNMESENNILLGTVVRSDVGWYGVEVNIPGKGLVFATPLVNMVNKLHGTLESFIPPEGSEVLVLFPKSSSQKGIILGALPSSDSAVYDYKWENVPIMHILNPESYSTIGSEEAYINPILDKKESNKLNISSTRPADLLPGHYALLNNNDVGLSISSYTSSLRGGPRARIQTSFIDDTVKIISGYFQHFNSGGYTQLYNDGGYITEESGFTSYQCERSGANKIGIELFKDLQVSDKVDDGKRINIDHIKAKATARKRLQSYIGYYGDLVNIFVAKPDPNIDIESEGDENKDQGLMHIHADSSGRIIMRSAAGVLFQRWDRIPIPKRVKQPWDPEGDKIENEPPDLNKEPYKWPENHPYARSLLLRDANAWRIYGSYYHLFKQSKQDDKKDFYLPNEGDLKVPDDEYDTVGKGTELFQKNDKRQATLSLEDDGSVIIRDAWGSEIIMRGGNIIFNCAGQLEFKSGKNTVILAGDDFIVKARESADITVSNKDLRLKANNNLHILCEGKDTSGGGILIESKSKGSFTPGTWNGKGEDVKSKGITLLSRESRVYLNGEKVHLSGDKGVDIDTFDKNENNKVAGNLMVSVKNVNINADNNVNIGVGKTSSLLIQKTNAILAAPNAVLAGETGAFVAKGQRIMVPLAWSITKVNFYEKAKSVMTRFYSILKEKLVSWLSGYAPKNLKNIRFTYRNSRQYGTDKASEIDGDSFKIYQPFWVFMAKNKAETVTIPLVQWEEMKYEIDKTLPWPGYEVYNNCYYELTKELNVNSNNGIMKNMKELTNNPPEIISGSFERYEVTQQ